MGFHFRLNVPGRSQAVRGAPAGPLSAPPGSAFSRWFGGGFFLVFFLIGSVLLWAFLVRPLLKIREARHWIEVPCQVLSSEVRRHAGEDGDTYSVHIRYAYVHQEREYESDRYHFMGGSSSGYRGKAKIVQRHPPGARTVCYVNPANPSEAVLERGYTGDLWFGLIPLVFTGIGLVGMVFFARRHWGPARAPGPSPAAVGRARPTAPAAIKWAVGSGDPTGPVTLKPAGLPWGKAIGMTVFAGIWCGIIGGVALRDLIRHWGRGSMDWVFGLFMLPFVAAGVWLLILAGRAWLELMNPRPRLTLSTGHLPLGSDFELSWRVGGGLRWVRQLRFTLEAREEATYTVGTRTTTDQATFYTQEIYQTREPAAMRSGRARITLPAEAMHSFQSEHNRIVWAIYARGEIPWWPDLAMEFQLHVQPQARSAISPVS